MGGVPDGKTPIPVGSPASGRRDDRAGILPSVIAGAAAVLAAVVAGVFTLFASSGGGSTGGASTSEANNPKSAHGAPTTSGMETLAQAPLSPLPAGRLRLPRTRSAGPTACG